MLAGLTTGNTPPWAVLLPAPSLATAAPAVSTAVTSDAEQQARQQQHQPQDQQQDQQQQQAQQQQGWWGLPRQQGQAKRARPSPRQGNKRCKTSQFRGVASTENGLWRCRIRFGKQTVHLGRFNNERDAALAYDRAASMLLGDSAKLNFEARPPEDDEACAAAATAMAICQGQQAAAFPVLQQPVEQQYRLTLETRLQGSTPHRRRPQDQVQEHEQGGVGAEHGLLLEQEQEWAQLGAALGAAVLAFTQPPPEGDAPAAHVAAGAEQAWGAAGQEREHEQQRQRQQEQEWQDLPSAHEEGDPQDMRRRGRVNGEDEEEDEVEQRQPAPPSKQSVVQQRWQQEQQEQEQERQQQQQQSVLAPARRGGFLPQPAAGGVAALASGNAQANYQWPNGVLAGQAWLGGTPPHPHLLAGRRELPGLDRRPESQALNHHSVRGSRRGRAEAASSLHVRGSSGGSGGSSSSGGRSDGGGGSSGDGGSDEEGSWDFSAAAAAQQCRGSAEYAAAIEQLGQLLEADPQLMLWSLMHASRKDAPPRRASRRAQRMWSLRAEQRAAAVAAVSALVAANARHRAVPGRGSDRGGGGSGGGSAGRRRRRSKQASKQGAQLALPLAMFDVTLCVTATCLYFMS
ncbi:hypothetical protein MNEG_1998 [Monoraphidium neglectum]|uniref:AP2/ERF domain-containing protein n=1 Tax=Monoraphidium neglectum TaxID=145388 RepID=A0A0D2N072_9CHLO|nr:hypothetical protein MNEG_1998 [Monoraphidium neglectum]KIZ05957.1 hypothetical protein MNEG_1998 [Monoraphidium neglectum]|eukprot:XP_013904976.1 hypothetical protein MNEG_1998 [Monoraphidium neglectum]